MKTNIQRLTLLSATLTCGLLLAASPAKATNYAGNGSTAWGGSVGTGTLTVTDDGTNLTFTIVPTGGNFGGNGVALFIDTGTGGFTNTSGFQDASDGGHSVVSGYSGSAQSVMTFASGFQPKYAISFSDGYTSLYQLANGGNGSFTYLTGTGTSPHTLIFPAATLGLTPGVTANIRIFGSLISQSGYRSPEAIAGNDTGSAGWNPFTQTAFSTYVFSPAVIVTNFVTFSVDMTEQVALGNFNPANGDTVYAAGTFQSVPWSGFLLTNNPSAANTNIYTGTYPDQNAAGTAEQYKYNYHSLSGGTNVYENITTLINRSFVLSSGAVLPTAYFSNIPASPSATTNTIAFQIDMGPQIYLGNFNPGSGDLIEVFGSFQNSPWSAGFILTNNPAIAQSNIYSGTFTDGNYPGTQYQYKYVIIAGGNNNYETSANRSLVTPVGSVTLPLAYFNNASNVYATPITFQVDMSAPIAAGTFNYANSDTVSAAGTFQSSLSANQWKAGLFVLTNNPAAANTNIFTGTYIDPNPPGTGEQFKFQINPAGNSASANWESVANRYFVLNSTAQTNPLVFWNNQDPNLVLLAPTAVAFSIDMANAMDEFGYPFNPSSDQVVVNGNFTNPEWPNFWQDPNLGGVDYQGNLLYEVGLSTIYTNTFTVPSGKSLQMYYKYGIIHNYTGYANTNCDNEAGFNQNHSRYIRTTGSYTLPVDVFGMQRTNLTAATEQPIMNLAIGSPVAGHLPISWLGLPGTYLQYTTNLINSVWVNLSATTGASAASWPATNGSTFFRVTLP